MLVATTANTPAAPGATSLPSADGAAAAAPRHARVDAARDRDPLLPTLAVNCCEVPASGSAVGGDTPTLRTTTVKFVVSEVVNCEFGIAGTLAVTLTTLLDPGAETVIGKLALVCPAGIVSALPPFSTTWIAGELFAAQRHRDRRLRHAGEHDLAGHRTIAEQHRRIQAEAAQRIGVAASWRVNQLSKSLWRRPQPEGKARSVRRLLVRERSGPAGRGLRRRDRAALARGRPR